MSIPEDVRRLVIAARKVVFEDPTDAALDELDDAAEAFAERVAWDEEPEDDAAQPSIPMSDMIEMYRGVKDHRKAMRRAFGVACPRCLETARRASATILLPQQRCRVDGYVDPRPELTSEQHQAVEDASQ